MLGQTEILTYLKLSVNLQSLNISRPLEGNDYKFQ
jgi:hypothetical protein